MEKNKCEVEGCKGELVSLYYKVGTTWKLVKRQQICPKCQTIYFVSVVLRHHIERETPGVN